MHTVTIEAVGQSNVLRVLIAGEFSLEQAKSNFLEAINFIEEHQSEKILIDGRMVVGDPAVVERFYYGEYAADAVGQLRERGRHGKNPQFAYVMHEPVLDPLRFGETVAANRGMHIKAFDSLLEAIMWLKLAPEEVDSLRDKTLAPETN